MIDRRDFLPGSELNFRFHIYDWSILRPANHRESAPAAGSRLNCPTDRLAYHIYHIWGCK